MLRDVSRVLFYFFLHYYCMQKQQRSAQQRAPCISCELPGASVQSSTWGSPPLLSASLFCKWRWTEGGEWGRRGGGGNKMLQRLRGSAWLSSTVQPNLLSFFFFLPAAAFEPSSSTPNYCISQSMQSLDSSELGHCLMCHSVRIWRALMKRLLRMKKVHFCDATF